MPGGLAVVDHDPVLVVEARGDVVFDGYRWPPRPAPVVGDVDDDAAVQPIVGRVVEDQRVRVDDVARAEGDYRIRGAVVITFDVGGEAGQVGEVPCLTSVEGCGAAVVAVAAGIDAA